MPAPAVSESISAQREIRKAPAAIIAGVRYLVGAGDGTRAYGVLLGKQPIGTFVNTSKATKVVTTLGEKWLREAIYTFAKTAPAP